MNVEKKGFKAYGKSLPVSYLKVLPIANLVRDKSYLSALPILDGLPNKGALILKKLLKSAASNALYLNSDTVINDLYIKSILVDQGPSRVRIWHRSRGRADQLLRRTTHLRIELGSFSDLKQKHKAGK